MRTTLLVVTAVIGIALTVLAVKMKGSVYSDLYPTYVAAKLLSDGKSSSVYANTPYSETRNPDWVAIESTLPDGADKTVFSYAPAYLFAMTGFLKILNWNYLLFLNLFFLINILSLAFISCIIIRKLRASDMVSVAIVFLFTTAYTASVTFKLGQNMFLVFIAFVFYIRAIFERRIWLSILTLLIAVSLKPWAILFVLIPGLNKDLKLFLSTTLSVIAFLGAQYLLWPDLFGGYWKLSVQHSAISVLAYNNMSLQAALQRFSMADWTKYVNWSNAGAIPILAKGIALLAAASLGLIAWISHRPAVIVTAFLLMCTFTMNVFWNFYCILFFPIWLDLIQRKKGAIALTLMLLLCFYFHPVAIYSAFSQTVYKIFPYSMHDRVAVFQFLLPTLAGLLSLYLVVRRTGFKNQLNRFMERRFYLISFLTLKPKRIRISDH